MARVKINLICCDCGESFEHIHFCNNRRDADSYETWARDNITQCPACYRKAQLAKKLEGLNLPEITGGTEKQIAYARKLRDEKVSDNYIRKLIPGMPAYLEQCRERVANDPALAQRLKEKVPDLTGDEAIISVWNSSQRLAYLLATCGDAATLIDALNR